MQTEIIPSLATSIAFPSSSPSSLLMYPPLPPLPYAFPLSQPLSSSSSSTSTNTNQEPTNKLMKRSISISEYQETRNIHIKPSSLSQSSSAYSISNSSPKIVSLLLFFLKYFDAVSVRFPKIL